MYVQQIKKRTSSLTRPPPPPRSVRFVPCENIYIIMHKGMQYVTLFARPMKDKITLKMRKQISVKEVTAKQ
jgi:hypothetical protein